MKYTQYEEYKEFLFLYLYIFANISFNRKKQVLAPIIYQNTKIAFK